MHAALCMPAPKQSWPLPFNSTWPIVGGAIIGPKPAKPQLPSSCVTQLRGSKRHESVSLETKKRKAHAPLGNLSQHHTIRFCQLLVVPPSPLDMPTIHSFLPMHPSLLLRQGTPFHERGAVQLYQLWILCKWYAIEATTYWLYFNTPVSADDLAQ